MAAPDLDVIKEIPGYKVILKAVVKSQIQLLVEQLAAHTDEESIILTASVADGTLSHLGSESGKSFLEDHEDVKSQFLGFCLKYQHKKKQEKEKERLEQELQQKQVMLKQQVLSPQFSSGGPSPHFMPSRSPRHYSPRYQYGSGARHEPYHVMRPNWRPVNSDRAGQSPVPSQSTAKPDGQVIKMEPNDSENSDQSSSETATNVPNTLGAETEHKTGLPSPTVESANKDNDVSESELSSVNPEGLDSEIANLISGGETSSVLGRQGNDSQTQDSEIDPNVSVKFEAVTEHEMDLEITGVELGRPGVPQDDWPSNMSMDMNFDPLGATGSQSDLQGSQQGYTTQPLSSGGVDSSMNTRNYSMYTAGHNLHYSTKDDTSIADDKSAIKFSTIGGKFDDKIYICAFCGKGFCRNWLLKRHLMIHTGEKPFHCNYCGKRFNQLSSLKKHFITHMHHC